ncbi:MAG: alpha/beta fold hydrolase [Solirubrobacterales bacterium]|nr:alpha/beta fold hydrolase [Solirubrobacterales bacterium]MBV9799154.1 alpha/beta fold hydrolase [Solirubrobacterales bacterium]
MRRPRRVTVALPTEVAAQGGLAYSVWLPPPQRTNGAGVLILHGAGSCKESHHDYARVVLGAGFAALAFDQRGHGESDSPMDGRVLEDIGRMAALLRARIGSRAAPLALRGSSMGGYLAILAGPLIDAGAVVAICPASPEGLRRGLRSETLSFAADVPALETFLSAHDLTRAVAALSAPLLLLHAEGDEQVPVQHSRELARNFISPGSRLITVPGGHHRSIQHDTELQAVSLRFIEQALGV